ncbi:MAG: hypothetical protein ACRELA_12945, partial [Candidatus Rokuibacteriota bacterium]
MTGRGLDGPLRDLPPPLRAGWVGRRQKPPLGAEPLVREVKSHGVKRPNAPPEGRTDVTVASVQARIGARSPAGEAWRRLRRNRLAMLGAALLVAMVAVAAVTPWITPY